MCVTEKKTFTRHFFLCSAFFVCRSIKAIHSATCLTMFALCTKNSISHYVDYGNANDGKSPIANIKIHKAEADLFTTFWYAPKSLDSLMMKVKEFFFRFIFKTQLRLICIPHMFVVPIFFLSYFRSKFFQWNFCKSLVQRSSQ